MTDAVHDGSHRRDRLIGIDDDIVIGGDSGLNADVIVVAGGGPRRLRSYQRNSVLRDGPSHRYDQLSPRNCSNHDDDEDEDAQPRLLGGRRRLTGGKGCLQIAVSVVVVCLVVFELVPPSLFLAAGEGVFDSLDWATVQVVLLALLCVFAVLLGVVGGMGADWATPRAAVWCGGLYLSKADVWFIALNVLPPAAWAIASCWTDTGGGESSSSSSSRNNIRFLRTVDGIGVVTARLARLDLVVSILSSSRGHSTWLNRATAGWLGLPETMSLHRSSGWWCVAQSAVHSTTYLLFYYLEGGIESVWFSCFPVADPRPGGCGEINRLGLVNFLGLVAFAAAMVPFLVVPALPWFRSSGYYHVFQRLHLLAAMAFVVASALHDLPVLTFAIPGIADWLMGRYELWREFRGCRRLTARARLLAGTSGPWVELAIDHSHLTKKCRRRPAPRGEWALLRVPALGGEVHPFTVATFPSSSSIVTALITAKGGDWTLELAALAATNGDGGSELEVDLYGPFESGGGDWSLIYEPALLLVVGGTGIFGYLPAFSVEYVSAMHRNRFLHLVWCVKTMADYRELAEKLPSQDRGVMITILVTDGRSRVDVVGEGGVDDATSALEAPHANAAYRSDLGIEELGCQELVDDIDQHENSIDCRCLEAFAPLATALSGLAFIHWGWTGIRTVLLPTKTSSSISYMLWWRLMPVVYVMVVVTITTVFSSWLANLLTRRNQGAEGSVLGQNGGRSLVKSMHYCGEGESHLQDSGHHRVDVQECDDDDGPRNECDKHFQTGRPDLTTLVRSAAVSAARRMAGRLMVVACGPPGLVQSTQDAVTLVRKEGCGVRLCFSGTDSRW
jgi:hypothetical protein